MSVINAGKEVTQVTQLHRRLQTLRRIRSHQPTSRYARYEWISYKRIIGDNMKEAPAFAHGTYQLGSSFVFRTRHVSPGFSDSSTPQQASRSRYSRSGRWHPGPRPFSERPIGGGRLTRHSRPRYAVAPIRPNRRPAPASSMDHPAAQSPWLPAETRTDHHYARLAASAGNGRQPIDEPSSTRSVGTAWLPRCSASLHPGGSRRGQPARDSAGVGSRRNQGPTRFGDVRHSEFSEPHWT